MKDFIYLHQQSLGFIAFYIAWALAVIGFAAFVKFFGPIPSAVLYTGALLWFLTRK